jgi:hypothetical protein
LLVIDFIGYQASKLQGASQTISTWKEIDTPFPQKMSKNWMIILKVCFCILISLERAV